MNSPDNGTVNVTQSYVTRIGRLGCVTRLKSNIREKGASSNTRQGLVCRATMEIRFLYVIQIPLVHPFYYLIVLDCNQLPCVTSYRVFNVTLYVAYVET